MSRESGSQAEMAQSASSRLPLFIFDDADRLSDRQIENIHECLQPRDRITAFGVLLGRPVLLTRLERSNPRLMKQGQTAHLKLQELGREEVETFIRRQLREKREISALTAEAITAIAETSGGDPALVNNLARLAMEFAEASHNEESTKLAGSFDALNFPASNGAITDVSNPGDTGSSGAKNHRVSLTSSVNPNLPRGDIKAGNGSFPEEKSLSTAERLNEGTPSAGAVGKPHHRGPAWILPIGILLCLAVSPFVLPSDRISSLVRRVEQRMAALDVSEVAAWTRQLRANFLPNILGNGQWDKTEPGVPRRDETADSLRKLTEQRIGQETQPLVLPNIAEPPLEIEARGSSTEVSLASRTAVSEEVPVTVLTPAAEPPAPAAANPSRSEQGPSTETPHSKLGPLAVESTKSELSDLEIAALVARGDFFVSMRDFASARLFYTRAAEAGDGSAALRMGATFDPAFLDRAGIRTEPANRGEAVSWYRRARDLGITEAQRRLKTFNVQHN